ncbi:MAG TPA: hypothetical protein VK607_09825 [Kofleriaceae bacterium]|nr:hypothetical protein [Kofleriaceae bacterium]
MPENNDNHPSGDKKVKDLLDSGARADLERWFGLPSFEAMSERGVEVQPPPEDPAFVARRKRQEEALAAVDPAMLERHRRRTDAMAAAVVPLPPLALCLDTGIARFDAAMLEQRMTVAEPREVERPGDLEDALTERTPQALLRDLHRPELDFHKRFEWVDAVGEARIDVAASVSEMMKTSMKLPPFEGTPFQQGRALLLELRADRHQPWINIEMPLRRVTE